MLNFSAFPGYGDTFNVCLPTMKFAIAGDGKNGGFNMSFIVVVVVIAIIISFFFSWFIKEDGKNVRTIANCIIILLVAIFDGIAITDNGGMFGSPCALDRKTYYKVLSVTPIDEKSTVVILRDGDDKIVPIKFITQITADTNGFYTLTGDNYKSYTLVPIK